MAKRLIAFCLKTRNLELKILIWSTATEQKWGAKRKTDRWKGVGTILTEMFGAKTTTWLITDERRLSWRKRGKRHRNDVSETPISRRSPHSTFLLTSLWEVSYNSKCLKTFTKNHLSCMVVASSTSNYRFQSSRCLCVDKKWPCLVRHIMHMKRRVLIIIAHLGTIICHSPYNTQLTPDFNIISSPNCFQSQLSLF